MDYAKKNVRFFIQYRRYNKPVRKHLVANFIIPFWMTHFEFYQRSFRRSCLWLFNKNYSYRILNCTYVSLKQAGCRESLRISSCPLLTTKHNIWRSFRKLKCLSKFHKIHAVLENATRILKNQCKGALTRYRKFTLVSAHAWNWMKFCTMVA